MNRFLAYLAERTPFLGQDIDFTEPTILAMLQAVESHAVAALVNFLQDEGLVAHKTTTIVALTGKGLLKAEELAARYTASTQGFVAM